MSSGVSPLDLTFVRSHFPAFESPGNDGQSFFENAGGSYACRETIEALTTYYTATKVQPYADYRSSADAGSAMDRSRRRWAEALGVDSREVIFGPSTSMNTYVLAHAFADVLVPGDEVIVTNQDHEANTGAIRRMADRVGCTLREWRIDPVTGRLDLDGLRELLNARTRLVTVPHASNIIGEENPIADICAAAHDVGARVVVDGVSFVPHSIPDVAALLPDVYLFSLYKTYSVHQGLMVVRGGLLAELPNQGHFFNADFPDKRLNPAGPDHAQVAAAGAVLDYVEAFDRHHDPAAGGGLSDSVRRVSARWRGHEDALAKPLLDWVSAREDLRLLGPQALDGERHRCPTIAFSPSTIEPIDLARALVSRGVQTSSGHYYAVRVLDGVGIDPDRGVVRLSSVHYTSTEDVERAITALDEVLAS
ncbi:MAG: aminotransferase class V-fold PLP-dependent enzyme [Acidimicrobiia bacterium]|nr:aminotransferase class V-fold PLP-dependent enzyme [Acidimicrobiia bacterium]